MCKGARRVEIIVGWEDVKNWWCSALHSVTDKHHIQNQLGEGGLI